MSGFPLGNNDNLEKIGAPSNINLEITIYHRNPNLQSSPLIVDFVFLACFRVALL
jgi:hypothetical protein